jgi:hypothetical protein
MSYKTKIELEADTTVVLGAEGQPTSVEGYYLGAKLTPDKGYGPGILHIFQTTEGNVGVWGKSHLNKLLTAEHRGQMCRPSFVEMSEPKKRGQKPSYRFKLEYDESNTIDISNVVTISGPSFFDESEDQWNDAVPVTKNVAKETASFKSKKETLGNLIKERRI